ncbi:MAG: tyrosine-type recombinase/integrase [Bacteroidetes bacterium]|nr:tyrosine-type recombinase/integrase [Bacteroidota bacterium]MCL1969564.1 tyrosine-type recombinase/integrase [Bacteroidota bacterium]
MNLINIFLSYLQFEKRASEHTVVSYRNDLEQFLNYLQQAFPNTEWREVDAVVIRTWIITLMEEKITSRTINRKISTLKSFYKYHIKMGIFDTNPLLQVHAPKVRQRLPQFVEEIDMEKLFSADIFENSFEGWRDQTILELFYATGMRLSELRMLTFSDFDLYNNQVKVLGKRNKERIIPFGHNFQNILTKYVEWYSEIFGTPVQNNFVFVNVKGKLLAPKNIYSIVRKYLDMITTIEKRSPHVIRHTFATHLLNRGADLNTIKELLGHSSLAATQIYTHNSIEKLKTIYKQAHPRA